MPARSLSSVCCRGVWEGAREGGRERKKNGESEESGGVRVCVREKQRSVGIRRET